MTSFFDVSMSKALRVDAPLSTIITNVQFGENFVSSTSPAPKLPTEKSVIPNSEDTQPSLSRPNVVVDNNEPSKYNLLRLKSTVWKHFAKENINNEWKAIYEATVDLAKLIIKYDYPLSIVDHALLRKYCHTLQPLFDMPSRNTIKKDTLDMYENGKVKTMLELEANEGRVAIKIDMWIANRQSRSPN
ncbi:hypothetical protein V6N11_069921 [Hibiscus sabdariffa]|uniref:Uncharacterized protein n=2 Tax=Hibiscus sabdariffa TaxID=183260 RepID=A0ABR2NH48_9ROSI